METIKGELEEEKRQLSLLFYKLAKADITPAMLSKIVQADMVDILHVAMVHNKDFIDMFHLNVNLDLKSGQDPFEEFCKEVYAKFIHKKCDCCGQDIIE